MVFKSKRVKIFRGRYREVAVEDVAVVERSALLSESSRHLPVVERVSVI